MEVAHTALAFTGSPLNNPSLSSMAVSPAMRPDHSHFSLLSSINKYFIITRYETSSIVDSISIFQNWTIRTLNQIDEVLSNDHIIGFCI